MQWRQSTVEQFKNGFLQQKQENDEKFVLAKTVSCQRQGFQLEENCQIIWRENGFNELGKIKQQIRWVEL